MTLWRKLAHLVGILRRLGLYDAVLTLSASRWAPPHLLMVNEVEILRLADLNAKALARVPGGYDWSSAGPDAMGEVLGCATHEARPVPFARFLAEGACCYVARHRGRVVAYLWAFTDRYVLTYDGYERRNLTVPLDAQSVFLGNGMIDEAHRLRGVFPHLVAFAVSQRPPGTRVYSAVERANHRSRLSQYRLGFVPAKHVLCVTVLGVTRFFTRAAAGERWTPQPAGGPLVLARCQPAAERAPVAAVASGAARSGDARP